VAYAIGNSQDGRSGSEGATSPDDRRHDRGFEPSGPYQLYQLQISERGARMARRDDREYREYLREEQRSQSGCPARKMLLIQLTRATSRDRELGVAGTAPRAPSLPRL